MSESAAKGREDSERPDAERRSRLAARLREWAGIFSAYFTAQGVTQATGLVAGLLLVNVLPVGEFALYTFASSVLSFFTFATDLGSTSSLLYFFNQAAREKRPFEPYLVALFSLRRVGFLLGAMVVLVVLPWVGSQKGFARLEVGLATLAVVAAVWFQLDGSPRILALRLTGRFAAAYRAEMASGLTRLILVAGLILAGWLFGWLAMAANALAAAVAAVLARRDGAVARANGSGRAHRREILRYLLPTLPGSAYFAVQGPLVIWLATTFGSTRTMAEAGALGRLGMVLTLFTSLSGIVFLPRLARITDERLYRRRYLQFGAFLVLVGVALLVGAWLWPELFLLLIGPRYAGLDAELLLVVAGAGVGLLGGYAVGVNNARSWTRWTGGAVVLLVLAQGMLVSLLPLATTAGVLLFGLLTAVFGLLCQLVFTVLGFTRPRWVKW